MFHPGILFLVYVSFFAASFSKQQHAEASVYTSDDGLDILCAVVPEVEDAGKYEQTCVKENLPVLVKKPNSGRGARIMHTEGYRRNSNTRPSYGSSSSFSYASDRRDEYDDYDDEYYDEDDEDDYYYYEDDDESYDFFDMILDLW